MPYIITGNCPNCGAPIIVSGTLNQAGQMIQYKVEYNCNCYPEHRQKAQEEEK